ncbi:MAG TPA: hypothetical protein ACQGQX_00025 [Xylella taiwanensis]
MKSEHKKFIADHGRYILAVFFFVPMIISQCAIWIGATDIGFVSGWETSYREAFGGAEGYSLTVVMYWVMSPLAFLWVHSKVNYQGMSLKKAIIMIPAIWLLSIFFGVFLFKGVFVTPLDGTHVSFIGRRFAGGQFFSLGRWHFGFCMIYASFVWVSALIWYGTLYLSLRLILNRL